MYAAWSLKWERVDKVLTKSSLQSLQEKLDPVGSTVRYELMKLCTGSVQHTMRRWQLVIGDTGSMEGIYAFIYCTKWRSGQVSPMPH